MDILNLSSVFSRVRNPQGVRRWGFWEQRPAKAVPAPARVTQELLVAGQNFGVNNLPPTQFFPDVATQLIQPLAGQDWWVRPAARWFQVDVSVSGLGVLITATSGSPFVVVDPVDSLVNPGNPHKISAQIGEDIVLDYGAGARYQLKITSVTPNAVTAVPKTGGVVPAAALGVFAFHRLDAYFLELTTTYVVPNNEINPAPGVDLQVRSAVRLVYYKAAGTPINQDYASVRLRSLAGTPFFAVTPITGSRFGVAATTSYSQISELFQIVVARVPDEVQLLLNQVRPAPGRVAQPTVYMGDMINVSVPIVTNLLAVAPANAVDQQQYAPVDPLDQLTASGDIVMVSVGQGCPAGYESVAQVDSLFNDSYVKVEGGANDGQAAAISFTASFASGVTSFTGALPATPASTHELAGPQNNGSTYELLAIRNGKRFAYRIRDITFSTAGVISFQIPADLRFLINIAADKVTAYLYQSGLMLRSAMNEAGQYSKPFVSDVDIQLSQWSFSDDGVQAAQGLTLSTQDGYAWLDRVLVANAELFTANDVVSFRDVAGALLAVPLLTHFLSDPGARNLAALAANYPFGPYFRVMAVNVADGYLVLASLAGNPATDVVNYIVTNAAVRVDLSGYVIAFDIGSGTPFEDSPPTFQDNYYRIVRGSVEHTHLIDVSADQQVKVYNGGGHWVAKAEHYHALAPEAVTPPFVKILLCSRL